MFAADLTSELNVCGDVSDNVEGRDTDLASIEASLQAKVETVRSQSAAVEKECQHIKEELTRAQREHEMLREQRLSQKEARTAALPKAR